jgi:hypothetical protein
MKINCSKIGLLMTEPKLKVDKEAGNLSETAKTMIREQWLFDNYGYKEIVVTDEMQKGNECEQDSMALVQSVLKCEFRVKYKNKLSNDYIKGYPDIVLTDCVEDIKTSWSIKTFMNAELTDLYEWQLIGYMWLTGKQKARLIYCLVDSPESIIVNEQLKYYYKYGADSSNQNYKAAKEQVRMNHVYSHIPEKDRIKIYNIEYNEDKIQMLIDKCNKANEYYNTLKL